MLHIPVFAPDQMFRHLDKDNSGIIDAQAVAAVARQLRRDEGIIRSSNSGSIDTWSPARNVGTTGLGEQASGCTANEPASQGEWTGRGVGSPTNSWGMIGPSSSRRGMRHAHVS